MHPDCDALCFLQLALDAAEELAQRQQEMMGQQHMNELQRMHVDMQNLQLQLAKREAEVSRLQKNLLQVRRTLDTSAPQAQ